MCPWRRRSPSTRPCSTSSPPGKTLWYEGQRHRQIFEDCLPYHVPELPPDVLDDLSHHFRNVSTSTFFQVSQLILDSFQDRRRPRVPHVRICGAEEVQLNNATFQQRLMKLRSQQMLFPSITFLQLAFFELRDLFLLFFFQSFVKPQIGTPEYASLLPDNLFLRSVFPLFFIRTATEPFFCILCQNKRRLASLKKRIFYFDIVANQNSHAMSKILLDIETCHKRKRD